MQNYEYRSTDRSINKEILIFFFINLMIKDEIVQNELQSQTCQSLGF